MKEKIFKITLLFLLIACVNSVHAETSSEKKLPMVIIRTPNFELNKNFDCMYHVTVYYASGTKYERTGYVTFYFGNSYVDIHSDVGNWLIALKDNNNVESWKPEMSLCLAEIFDDAIQVSVLVDYK